jgi:hypothetical protein
MSVKRGVFTACQLTRACHPTGKLMTTGKLVSVIVSIRLIPHSLPVCHHIPASSGTLAHCDSLPACHTRKGGERHACAASLSTRGSDGPQAQRADGRHPGAVGGYFFPATRACDLPQAVYTKTRVSATEGEK